MKKEDIRLLALSEFEKQNPQIKTEANWHIWEAAYYSAYDALPVQFLSESERHKQIWGATG